MGSRARIRWTNVARLAAGAIACTALVVGLPALLERPKPPPLPEDIGLTQARRAPPPTPTGSPEGGTTPSLATKAPDPSPTTIAAEPQRPSPGHERPRGRSPHTGRRSRPTPVPVATPRPPPPAAPAPPASPAPYVPPAPPRPRRDELALPSSQLVAGGRGGAVQRTFGIRLRALTNYQGRPNR